MKAKITHLSLIAPTLFGGEAVPLTNLMVWRSYEHQGTKVDGKPVVLSFDGDDRFIRVEWGGPAMELVPMSNVAGITCVPEEAPVKKEKAASK